MKFIVLEEGADNMLVFDFNRLALRKAEANPSNNPSTMEIVTSQSSVNPILDELQTSPLTESDLTTSLPYRVKKVPVPQRPGEDPVQAVMISETSIIAVLVRTNQPLIYSTLLMHRFAVCGGRHDIPDPILLRRGGEIGYLSSRGTSRKCLASQAPTSSSSILTRKACTVYGGKKVPGNRRVALVP